MPLKSRKIPKGMKALLNRVLDRKSMAWPFRGSAQECVPLMEIAKRKGFMKEEEYLRLLQKLETISKMIAGLINGLEKAKETKEMEKT